MHVKHCKSKYLNSSGNGKKLIEIKSTYVLKKVYLKPSRSAFKVKIIKP